MADILNGAASFNVSAIQQGAYQTANTASTFGFYLLIGLLLGALMFLWFYKRSFNIRVKILDNRNGKTQTKVGYWGKITQTRPGEFRFKLWAAKSNKFRFMEEGLKPEDVNDEVVGNKIRKSVTFTFDEEGVLVPVRETIVLMKKNKIDANGVTVLDPVTGVPVVEYTPKIEAIVRQADLALFYKELDKSHELFDAKSFMDKYGWIVMIILMILFICAVAFLAFKISDGLTTTAQISADQTKMLNILAQAQMHNFTGVQVV